MFGVPERDLITFKRRRILDRPFSRNPRTNQRFRPDELAMKSLTFRHRFRSGSLCEMTFHLQPNGMPGRPHYVWNGPVPKLRGERLAWELSCFRTIAECIGGPTFYGAHLRTGETKIWRCDSGRKPKRVPFAEVIYEAALIVASHNVDDQGNTWPL